MTSRPKRRRWFSDLPRKVRKYFCKYANRKYLQRKEPPVTKTHTCNGYERSDTNPNIFVRRSV